MLPSMSSPSSQADQTHWNSSSLITTMHTTLMSLLNNLQSTNSTSDLAPRMNSVTATAFTTTANLTTTPAFTTTPDPGYKFDVGPTATHILVFLLVSLVIFAIIGNFTLMGMIVTVRKLHSKTHIFIVDLTVSDILVALTVVPIDIEKLIRQGFFHGIITCEFVSVMFFMSLPASALSLSLLTLERYITLKYPLTHHKILTRKRAIAALVIKWIYVIVVASLPAMGWVYRSTMVVNRECNFYFTTEYAVFMVATNFVLPLLVILFANIEIFRIANHAALKMQKSTRRNEKRRASLIAIGANVKAAKRIMLLVGLFLLSWVPYITSTLVMMICQNACFSKLRAWIVVTLNFSSAAINPILYGLLNKDVRHEIRKKLREISFKCTKNKFDKPFTRASRTECMHSVSIATERELFNVKDGAHETTL